MFSFFSTNILRLFSNSRFVCNEFKWHIKQVTLRQAKWLGKQTGKQAGEQAGEQAGKQAGKQAVKQVGKQADKHLEGIQMEPCPVGAC